MKIETEFYGTTIQTTIVFKKDEAIQVIEALAHQIAYFPNTGPKEMMTKGNHRLVLRVERK